MVTVRIAVCSRNGIAVDEHFGRANSFYVYDVGRNTIGLAAIRLTERYCDGTCENEMNEDRLRRIYRVLDDCRVLFTEMIGPGPRLWLEQQGLTVMVGKRGVTALIDEVKNLKKKELIHA